MRVLGLEEGVLCKCLGQRRVYYESAWVRGGCVMRVLGLEEGVL